MQKTSFFFLTVILSLFSVSVQAQDQCPVKNHIFLIHGVGGSAGTFGSLEKVLNHTSPCYRARTFVYETGNSALSTFDFMNAFQLSINELVKKNEISSRDKISLIMHSQGGLVGSLWLNSVAGTPLYEQVDSFITLSTPFWGADMANLGQRFFYSLPEGVPNPISPFGRIELNEMSFGSGTIRHLVRSFQQNFFPHKVRPLAIAGIHKIGNSVLGENDAVVPIYSSRADIFKGVINTSIKAPEGRVPADVFIKTALVPFVTVPATHFRLDLPGVADVPVKCMESEKCNHPALPFIMNHLAGVMPPVASDNEFKHFRTTLYLNNETGITLNKRDVKIEIVENEKVTIPLAQKLTSYRGKAALKTGLAYSIHGSVKEKSCQKIRIVLTVKNLLKREIEVPVEGGHTTMLEMNLVP